MNAAILSQVVFLHYGGADENAPLLFVVGVGVLVGLFLAWRRGRRE
jgi:LPXTG-motif cell wall-anchored protein